MEIANARRSNPNTSLEDLLLDIAKKEVKREDPEITDDELTDKGWKKIETLRVIRRKLKKIESLLKRLLFQYRGKSVGFMVEMPPPEEFNPMLKHVFNLDKVLASLDQELSFYKEIRYIYKGVEYSSDLWLSRSKSPSGPETQSGLVDIFKRIANRENRFVKARIYALGFTISPLSYIEELYWDFRYWETTFNDKTPEDEIALERALKKFGKMT